MLQIDDYFWMRASFESAQPAGTLFKNQTIFAFGPVSSFETAVIIFLLGSADILDSSAKVIYRQRANLAISGAPVSAGRSKSRFQLALNAVGLDVAPLERYLQKAHAQQSYFKEIILELVHYADRSRRGQHTMAFLHLYRILERVSYVFPITYAIKSQDFKGTYDAFKGFIVGEKSGELKFFQKFQIAAIDEAQRKASMKLDFSGLPFGGEAAGFKLVKKFISNEFITSQTKDVELTIESQGILELAINLRNRFFHAGSGHNENISLVLLSDPDGFFGRINGHMLNWITIIYVQTLMAKSDPYN